MHGNCYTVIHEIRGASIESETSVLEGTMVISTIRLDGREEISVSLGPN